MDVQHDSIMFLEKVTVPSRRKKLRLWGFRLARNLVPQRCPALVPQKRHQNLIRMYPEMSRKESPGPVDRSRYPVFRSPISSRGDIAAGRGLVKSLEIPRESAPRRPSRLSPTISSSELFHHRVLPTCASPRKVICYVTAPEPISPPV